MLIMLSLLKINMKGTVSLTADQVKKFSAKLKQGDIKMLTARTNLCRQTVSKVLNGGKGKQNVIDEIVKFFDEQVQLVNMDSEGHADIKKLALPA